MITENKLKIYKKYFGNIENWDRFGKQKDKTVLEYEEWELIDDLLQNLELIEKDLVSKDYKNKILSQLNNICGGEKVKKELESLVGKYD